MKVCPALFLSCNSMKYLTGIQQTTRYPSYNSALSAGKYLILVIILILTEGVILYNT
jgi:hypothetical protein